MFSGQIIAIDLNVPGSVPDEHFDRFRMRVEEVWKGNLKGIVELWEEASGYDLQFSIGQTALVYAERDDKGRLSSGRCRRGGALHESGADLAYLYFVRHRPQRSARLFGFITVDETDLKAQLRNWTDPPHPAWDATIKIEGPDGPLYTMIDGRGRFVVDGLTGGEYTLSIYGPEYLIRKRVVRTGIKVHVPPGGFARKELYVPWDVLAKE